MAMSYLAAIFFGLLFSVGFYYRDRVDSHTERRVQSVSSSSAQASLNDASGNDDEDDVSAKGDDIDGDEEDKSVVKKSGKRKSRMKRPSKTRSKTVEDSKKESAATPTPYLKPDTPEPGSEELPTAEDEVEEPIAPLATGLPDAMIKDILLKNKDITKCFLNERSNNGKVPDAAPLRFVVNPQGYVVDMKVYEGRYVGSSFERCLRSAIRKISFPPFEGKDQVIRYVLRPG